MFMVPKIGEVATSDRSLIMSIHESCITCSQIIAFLIYGEIHAIK